MWRSLNELLSSRLHVSRHRPQIEGATIIQEFQREVVALLPVDGAGSVRALKLVDDTLTIEVAHPAIAQILRQNETQLLQKLNTGDHKVRRFAFRVRRDTTES